MWWRRRRAEVADPHERWLRALTPGGYVETPDGGAYSVCGRYFIAPALWQAREREGRVDRAEHDFERGARVEEAGVADRWHRVTVTCRRCGEVRAVFHGCSLDELNGGDGWCVP